MWKQAAQSIGMKRLLVIVVVGMMGLDCRSSSSSGSCSGSCGMANAFVIHSSPVAPCSSVSFAGGAIGRRTRRIAINEVPRPTNTRRGRRSSSSPLYAISRRHIFDILRRIVFAGSVVHATDTTTTTSPAFAATLEENTTLDRLGSSWDTSSSMTSTTTTTTSSSSTSTTKGRIVELLFDNIDGIQGNSGTVKIQLRPEWAPRGVRRFEELTEDSFWDGCKVFRVVPGCLVQFGIHGKPNVQAKWRSSYIPDDYPPTTPVTTTTTTTTSTTPTSTMDATTTTTSTTSTSDGRIPANTRGTVVFANAGAPNTRTTQIFINTRWEGNSFLDKQGQTQLHQNNDAGGEGPLFFTPIGEVIDNGMELVDRFYSHYGEGPPPITNAGPNQAMIQLHGNSYLDKQFPKLSYIKKATFAS